MDCSVCEQIRLIEDDVIYRDPQWIAYPAKSPGWMMVAARRHAQWTWGLDESEQATVGVVLKNLSASMRAVTGTTHVYFVGLGENSRHFHLMLIPRVEPFAAEVRASIRGWSAKSNDPAMVKDVAAALRNDLVAVEGNELR